MKLESNQPNQPTQQTNQVKTNRIDALALERRRLFLNTCIASHTKAFDRASRLLDTAQGQPLIYVGVAHSAAKQMLFHLRELHNLTIDLKGL